MTDERAVRMAMQIGRLNLENAALKAQIAELEAQVRLLTSEKKGGAS